MTRKALGVSKRKDAITTTLKGGIALIGDARAAVSIEIAIARASFLATLQQISSHPHANANNKDWIEQELRWMKSNPHSGISPRAISIARTFLRVLRMLSEGKEIDPTKRRKPFRPRSRFDARQLLNIDASRTLKRTRPDWMADPNSLPKKPPGK